MKTKGARVSACTETINNIKVIKLYGWTNLFLGMIEEKRRNEIKLYFQLVKTLTILVVSI